MKTRLIIGGAICLLVVAGYKVGKFVGQVEMALVVRKEINEWAEDYRPKERSYGYRSYGSRRSI